MVEIIVIAPLLKKLKIELLRDMIVFSIKAMTQKEMKIKSLKSYENLFKIFSLELIIIQVLRHNK